MRSARAHRRASVVGSASRARVVCPRPAATGRVPGRRSTRSWGQSPRKAPRLFPDHGQRTLAPKTPSATARAPPRRERFALRPARAREPRPGPRRRPRRPARASPRGSSDQRHHEGDGDEPERPPERRAEGLGHRLGDSGAARPAAAPPRPPIRAAARRPASGRERVGEQDRQHRRADRGADLLVDVQRGGRASDRRPAQRLHGAGEGRHHRRAHAEALDEQDRAEQPVGRVAPRAGSAPRNERPTIDQADGHDPARCRCGRSAGRRSAS